jgi:DNA polymerase elongation subunit (family B)
LNILLLDIETAPNLAYVWGLFKQNISPDKITESSYVLCWSAKWLDKPGMRFDSIKKSDPKLMLSRIHTLLDRADAVVHYNGTKFDIPTLNKEFLKKGLGPPAPYKQIDLLQVARKVFRFESNKMDYVAQTLKIGEKVRHEGFELWVKCMEKDVQAWKKMEAYNRHDVVLLEKLYRQLIPWIENHPNHGAYEDLPVCPNCGGEHYQQSGFRVTKVMKYPRFHCQDCGTWFRGSKSVSPKGERFHTIL